MTIVKFSILLLFCPSIFHLAIGIQFFGGKELPKIIYLNPIRPEAIRLTSGLRGGGAFVLF